MTLENKLGHKEAMQKLRDRMGIIELARIPCGKNERCIEAIENYIEENKKNWNLKQTEVIGYEPFCFGENSYDDEGDKIRIPTKIFRYNATRNLFGRVRYKLVTA
jgi:hypothetical protein